jgi:hypothetical protein
MRFITLFVFLGFSVMLCGQESGTEYSIDVRRVNTEHGVKLTAILYVGADRYRVQTECFSYDADHPCIVPPVGMSSARYQERDAHKFLQLLTKPQLYGQQTMHEIVDIEVAQ